MNKEQLQKDIDAMRVKLSEMEAKLKEPEKKGVWQPVKGEHVFSLDSFGVVYRFIWAGSPSDLNLLLMGSIHRNQEEALAARDKRLAFVRVTNKLRELEGDWVADWNSHSHIKYLPWYDHGNGKNSTFKIGSLSYAQYASPELHSTKAACQWVIDNMESDLKLIYGVK